MVYMVYSYSARLFVGTVPSSPSYGPGHCCTVNAQTSPAPGSMYLGKALPRLRIFNPLREMSSAYLKNIKFQMLDIYIYGSQLFSFSFFFIESIVSNKEEISSLQHCQLQGISPWFGKIPSTILQDKC